MRRKRKKSAFDIFLYVVTFKWLFCGLILLYKKCISPLFPPVCIYTPTCSTYTLEAIEKFGVAKGTYMGVKRVMRCVPWKKGGFDPVPDNPKGDMKWLF